jgi:hypothetical protein
MNRFTRDSNLKISPALTWETLIQRNTPQGLLETLSEDIAPQGQDISGKTFPVRYREKLPDRKNLTALPVSSNGRVCYSLPFAPLLSQTTEGNKHEVIV